MKNPLTLLFITFLLATTLAECKKKSNENNQPDTAPPAITDSTTVKGYALLNKICGIWNGPITSTTAMGNFPEAPMDFRPISTAQVSSKNELDTANSLYMSFFIIWTGTEYQVAFRNGGTFQNSVRITYMTLDSVSENSSFSYYRFVDFVKGEKRTITEVSFWSDSLHIRAYTNQYNSQPTAVLHMDYRAGLQNSDAYTPAKNNFSFPQKQMVKDFSSAFKDVTESIYYSAVSDPYPASAQPYVGKSTLSYSVAANINLAANARVTLVVSTQPLIGQTGPITANFATISRYVFLYNPQRTFTFDYMHPGSYYLYAFVDANNNGITDSGDFISSANTAFTLAASGTVSQSTQINFQIP